MSMSCVSPGDTEDTDTDTGGGFLTPEAGRGRGGISVVARQGADTQR